MALDKSALAATFKDVFARAKDEAWSSGQVADALADAVHAYVSAAEVTGVTVDVRDLGNNPIGTGTQKDAGKLQ